MGAGGHNSGAAGRRRELARCAGVLHVGVAGESETAADGSRGPLEAPWPVTMGMPNAYGLFGIAANIHEWCADWHDTGFYAASPARNPAGPPDGVRRASRGGSWRHAVTISRSAARSRLHPSFRYTDYGFRIARDHSVEPAARGDVE